MTPPATESVRSISPRWLQSRGASAEQIALFRDTFGDGAVTCTEANLLIAADADIDLNWLAEEILPKDTLAEYRREEVLAMKEFLRAAAPARAEYWRVMRLPPGERHRLHAAAEAEYQRATAPARIEYRRTVARTISRLKRP